MKLLNRSRRLILLNRSKNIHTPVFQENLLYPYMNYTFFILYLLRSFQQIYKIYDGKVVCIIQYKCAFVICRVKASLSRRHSDVPFLYAACLTRCVDLRYHTLSPIWSHIAQVNVVQMPEGSLFGFFQRSQGRGSDAEIGRAHV